MRDQMEFERVQMEQTNVLQHSYGVTSCTLCGNTDSILADEHTRTKRCVLCAVTDETYCDACFLPWIPQWKQNMNLVQYTRDKNPPTVLQLDSIRQLLCYHCIADNEYDLEIKNLLSGCQADQLERVERQADETDGFPPPVVLRPSVISIRVRDVAAFRSYAADKAPGSTILPLLRAEATEGVLPRPAGFVEEEELELELEEVEDQELEEVD